MDSLISDGRYDDLVSGIRITLNTTLVVEVIVRTVRIVYTVDAEFTLCSRHFLRRVVT